MSVSLRLSDAGFEGAPASGGSLFCTQQPGPEVASDRSAARSPESARARARPAGLPVELQRGWAAESPSAWYSSGYGANQGDGSQESSWAALPLVAAGPPMPRDSTVAAAVVARW